MFGSWKLKYKTENLIQIEKKNYFAVRMEWIRDFCKCSTTNLRLAGRGDDLEADVAEGVENHDAGGFDPDAVVGVVLHHSLLSALGELGL